MNLPLPEPSDAVTGTKERFLAYLDFYRSVVVHKLDGMTEHDLRTSRLPSGWSPLELLKHLVAMERRWMTWRFAGEALDDPWADDGPHGRWRVTDDDSASSLVAQLQAVGRRTREIAESADLGQRAVPTEALGGSPAPTLEWVLFHLLQEYARHAGHLDIVRELVDGVTGEE
jgi:hypothetical protein